MSQEIKAWPTLVKVATSISLQQTCGACPEQYDAYFGDPLERVEGQDQVGYLRLRHGVFTVQCRTSGGDEVLYVYPHGDGIFEAEERERYCDVIVQLGYFGQVVYS